MNISVICFCLKIALKNIIIIIIIIIIILLRKYMHYFPPSYRGKSSKTFPINMGSWTNLENLDDFEKKKKLDLLKLSRIFRGKGGL